MATTYEQAKRGTKNSWTWQNITDFIDLHEDIDQGMTDHILFKIRSNVLTQDMHIDRITIFLENAPGAGKSVAVSITNGVSTITATVSESDVSATSTTNNFDWDASSQDLTLTYTSTAGTTPGHATIRVDYSLVTIT